jgi:predicted O-methyltransferase YrrM
VASFFQIKSYINHWLDKGDQHSIHSPYFFDFYNKVVNTRLQPACRPAIESIRANLLRDATEIEVEDLGSGKHRKGKRVLREIVKTSASPQEYSFLLLRICEYAGVRKIVELGTSTGLNSLYLSYAPHAQVYTFEGSHGLANVALTNFEYLDRKNIELLEGNIDDVLPEFLQRDTAKIGFAFLDANHLYAPTLRYFNMLMRRFNEKSIMVIDDIHSSAEMQKAWKELSHHPLVYGSVDLFRCGILFFEPGLNRQRYLWSL